MSDGFFFSGKVIVKQKHENCTENFCRVTRVGYNKNEINGNRKKKKLTIIF